MKKISTKNKKLNPEIYNDNYYKAQEMLLNPWFKRKITWLKNKFKEFGCPIPKNGFKTSSEYTDWIRDKFWKSYADHRNSPKFKKELNKITGGKSSWGSKEMDKIEALKLKLLPPIYGQIYDDILEKFNINKKDKGFRRFLEQHIFFNKNIFSTPPFSIHWIRNKKTKKIELFIKILGHTRKKDIVGNWGQISKEQKLLADHLGKNKKWPTFERDNEIYELYLKLKKKKRSGKNLGEYENRIDYLIMEEISKKHYRLAPGSVRSIISRVKKFRATSKEVD